MSDTLETILTVAWCLIGWRAVARLQFRLMTEYGRAEASDFWLSGLGGIVLCWIGPFAYFPAIVQRMTARDVDVWQRWGDLLYGEPKAVKDKRKAERKDRELRELKCRNRELEHQLGLADDPYYYGN
jgi:hypothetical protein